jgi:toxin-antitoxin system PIN domain toxin
VILADVNVLLNAFRRDARAHVKCREWLENVILGDAGYGESPLVLSAVMRIATNQSAYDPPSPMSEAVGFCEGLLSQPHCIRIQPGVRHWPIFTKLCIESGIRGKLVSDAWFAALAIEHGCEWISLDRDFNRFPGLRWRHPD